MAQFRDTLVSCRLGDLGYHGSKYTWSNKQEKKSFVKERLDRATATPSWCAKFLNVTVKSLPVTNLDHLPLLIQFGPVQWKPPKLFRYEAKWKIDEECHSVIQDAWNDELVDRIL
jgi:hypothetical protein